MQVAIGKMFEMFIVHDHADLQLLKVLFNHVPTEPRVILVEMTTCKASLVLPDGCYAKFCRTWLGGATCARASRASCSTSTSSRTT
jgi:hypothetical protein